MDPTYANITSSIDWGNAPSWAAFTTALIAAVLATGAYRRERRRDRAAWQARVQDQASKFAGWIEQDAAADPPRTLIYLRNASELPIYYVNIWFWPMDWTRHTTLEEVFKTFNELEGMNVVAPGTTTTITRPLLEGAHEITLTFTDAQGVFWSRHKGALSPHDQRGHEQPPWFRDIDWEKVQGARGTGEGPRLHTLRKKIRAALSSRKQKSTNL